MSHNTSVTIKPSLEKMFFNALKQYQIIMFSAPCGFGKTTIAKKLLSNCKVYEINVFNSVLLPNYIPKKSNVVMVDDLQYFLDSNLQKELCDLIRSRGDLKFILLTRGHVPGWLMPFQFAGTMLTIEEDKMFFDYETSQKMLESHGIEASKDQINKIINHTKGYPVAMDIICRKLKDGLDYNTQLLNNGRRELFFYFEEAIYLRFEVAIRLLLLSIAPFENFNLELAKIVSGDPRAGEFIAKVYRDTKMLKLDENNNYKFWPFFREFLMWELQKKLTDSEQRMLYSRAALYYELNEDFEKTLEFYSLAKEENKISKILIKNAEKNPSVGNYYEMRNYYFSLSKEEVRKNPSLISGMSMLSALCMDYEASENWYKELQDYGDKLKKSDHEYKSVQWKVSYLDVALPQRGSKRLIEIFTSIFKLIRDGQLKISTFSITSRLPSLMNGGKDFCEWSKKDEFLYSTMKKPLEKLLGRDGVGFGDSAICESKFEKGEDVSKELLTLMSYLGEIQIRGTPDIEFVVISLLARVNISQGKARVAKESIENLRDKFIEIGEIRFLPNMDAMICRIQMLLGERESVRTWLEEKAPKNDIRLWIIWRYQYLTQAMAYIIEEEYQDALILMSRLLNYCQNCERIMDSIYIHLLTSICYSRLEDENWESELSLALDMSYEYKFITPVAQYGIAILPLLIRCKWDKDKEYLKKLITETRTQAVQYPKFLKVQAKPIDQISSAEELVLKLLCENMSNQEISEILGIKLSTVKTHVSRILHKLGLKRRGEVKAVVKELNLL